MPKESKQVSTRAATIIGCSMNAMTGLLEIHIDFNESIPRDVATAISAELNERHCSKRADKIDLGAIQLELDEMVHNIRGEKKEAE